MYLIYTTQIAWRCCPFSGLCVDEELRIEMNSQVKNIMKGKAK